jgi:type II secretion system protein D
MRLSRPVFALIACGVLAAVPAVASAQDKPDDKDQKVVRLLPKEGGWAIGELFENIQKNTGISILFDSTNQTMKTMKVEFVGVHVIAEDELFNWLQAVLSYRKLVLVPVGPRSPDGKQQWFVMDQADPNLRSRPYYIREDDIYNFQDRDGLFVVTTLTLHHITDTTRVRTALQQLITQTAGIGKIQDVAGSRTLIVADFAPVVAAMKRLLDYIDVENPSISPIMEVVPLDYAVASELEPILTDLIQSSDNPQQRNAQRQPGQADEEPEPKIIADNRLDALIIYATGPAMAKIKDLIVRLDVPSRARGRLHFRPLRHTDADEMAKLLDDLVSSTSSSTSSPFAGSTRTSTSRNSTRNNTRTNTGGGGQPASGSPFGQSAVEGAPVFIADPKSNSLIVQASPTQWTTIEELIGRLDQSRPQVLIETSLLELVHTNDLKLGVELFGSQKDIAVDTNGDGVADTITQDTKTFGASSFDLSTLVTQTVGGTAGTAGSGVVVPTGRSPLIGPGFTAGIFKNGKLPIIFSALQTAGRARILTQPSLVTNDNEQATLSLQRTTSYSTTVRDSTNTTTDSFNQITANTELSISPHISSDDYLRLDITQSVANFGARPGGNPSAPPDQTTRRIDTHVTLPDTYTVVLGGLVQEDESTAVRKIPFLGDIPILGFLFRQSEDQSNPSHLFLFVTPHILRDTERFSDYHKLTWEKKLLQDDLFKSEVVFPGHNWAGPSVPKTARERLKRIEDSGELDSAVLKAPLTDEERRRMAEDELHRREREQRKDGTPQTLPADHSPPQPNTLPADHSNPSPPPSPAPVPPQPLPAPTDGNK